MATVRTITFKSTEIFHYDALKRIYDNYESEIVQKFVKEHEEHHTDEEDHYLPLKTRIFNYLTKAKVINAGSDLAEIKVNYKFAKEESEHGRQYPVGGMGLSSFMKCIRHTIAHDLYHDIDMKNCHPNILVQYCKSHQIPCEQLERSVLNNEQYLADLMNEHHITRDGAKSLKLAVINGGQRSSSVSWFTPYVTELEQIRQHILQDPENHKWVQFATQHPRKGKSQNIGGRVISHLLCDIENQLLMSSINYLKSIKVSVKNVPLCFDGFMINSSSFDPNPQNLQLLSEFVSKETGYRMTFVCKPMTIIIPLESLPLNPNGIEDISTGLDVKIVETDNEAVGYLMDAMEGKIFHVQDSYWVKNRDTRVWSSSSIDVENEIMNTCTDLKLVIQTSRGLTPYSSNVSGIKKMLTLCYAKVPRDDNFLDTLRKKSSGKLFFLDKVYDFNLKQYRDETDEDMTPIRIQRNAPTKIDPQFKTIVTETLNSIFARDSIPNELCNEAKSFLQHLARAFAGHLEDKDWLVGLGLRDCGKGILTGMCQQSFGPYVSIVDSSNFLIKPGENDSAKAKMWLISIMWSRLVVSNEIDLSAGSEKAVINGILIKSLASGGDEQSARTLYQNATKFVFTGRILILANDMPTITPSDACSTMSLFEFPNKFIQPDLYEKRVNEHQISPYEKKANPDLKTTIICDPNFANAFLSLVLEHYGNHKVINSPSITLASDEFRIDHGDETLFFKTNFIFTDHNATMTSKEIMEIVHRIFPNMSPQKVKSFLTKNMNCSTISSLDRTDPKSGKMTHPRGYRGIKLNPEVQTEIQTDRIPNIVSN